MLALSGTGCIATLAPGPMPAGPGSARTPAGEAPTPEAALGMVVVGSSTRSDVVARLGPAIAIPFDSGHAVWVYRWHGADRSTRSATELVLLFDPSGVVRKARLRPGNQTVR